MSLSSSLLRFLLFCGCGGKCEWLWWRWWQGWRRHRQQRWLCRRCGCCLCGCGFSGKGGLVIHVVFIVLVDVTAVVRYARIQNGMQQTMLHEQGTLWLARPSLSAVSALQGLVGWVGGLGGAGGVPPRRQLCRATGGSACVVSSRMPGWQAGCRLTDCASACQLPLMCARLRPTRLLSVAGRLKLQLQRCRMS